MKFNVEVSLVQADPRLVSMKAEVVDDNGNVVPLDPTKCRVQGQMSAGGVVRRGEMRCRDGTNQFIRNPGAVGPGPVAIKVSGKVNGRSVPTFEAVVDV